MFYLGKCRGCLLEYVSGDVLKSIEDGYPNLYIAGSAKCGTTSLTEVLRLSGSVYVPALEEPHFLSEEFPTAKYKILRAVRTLSSYRKLYKASTPHRYALDGSTSMICSLDAPVHVGRHVSPKVIFMFRDPVDRYISHYMNDVSGGIETRELPDVILADLMDGSCLKYSLLDYGMYATHLRRWGEFVPASNILCVDFHDFIANQKDVVSEILEFLGICGFTDVDVGNCNPSLRPRHPLIHRVMRFHRLRVVLRELMPVCLRDFIRKSVLCSSGRCDLVDEVRCREQLAERYAGEMKKLSIEILNYGTAGSFDFLKKFT